MVAKRNKRGARRSAAARERRTLRGQRAREAQGQSAGNTVTDPVRPAGSTVAHKENESAGSTVAHKENESAGSTVTQFGKWYVWGRKYFSKEDFDREVAKDI